MSTPNSTSNTPAQRSPVEWFKTHLPALLYGWFWFGMFLCGLLAPSDRVQALESGLVSEGWHLSVLALILGVPIMVTYWLRVSGRWASDR